MKNSEIEKKVDHAFRSITPDVLDSVLSDCHEQKGKVLIMTERKSNNKIIRRISGIAAALVIIAGGAFIWNNYNLNYAVASTVSLDVNPSVEIKVNQKEKVLSVTPLNEDGKVIIGDMDFEGNGLDITVNALIGSMLRNGYLSELTNSILISVDGDDPVVNAEIRQKLSDEVNALLNTESFSGAVLSQTVTADDDLRAAAEQNGISAGKAQLIQQITEQNSFYSFDDLAGLSINELNLLSASGSLKLDNVEAVGTASDKAYIGAEKAKEIALTHAGISESDIHNCEIELDYDHGVMVYDIEFDAQGIEYDYEIGAVDGSVVTSHHENDHDHHDDSHHSSAQTTPQASTGSTADAQTPTITEDEAMFIAVEHAGLPTESSNYSYEIELDHEKGILVYEIEFKYGEYEYDYEINASTGEVLKYDKEKDD